MTLSLKCHPDFPADAITSVNVELSYGVGDELMLEYEVLGDIAALELLDQSDPKRTDYLWQQTCFEAFIGAKGQKEYLEFNFSPSTEWAVLRTIGVVCGIRTCWKNLGSGYQKAPISITSLLS